MQKKNQAASRVVRMGVAAVAATVGLAISASPAHAVEGLTVATYPHLRLCEEAQVEYESNPAVRYTQCHKKSDTEFDLVAFYYE